MGYAVGTALLYFHDLPDEETEALRDGFCRVSPWLTQGSFPWPCSMEPALDLGLGISTCAWSVFLSHVWEKNKVKTTPWFLEKARTILQYWASHAPSLGMFLYLKSRHLRSFPKVTLFIEVFISKALWQRGPHPVAASESVRQPHSGRGVSAAPCGFRSAPPLPPLTQRGRTGGHVRVREDPASCRLESSQCNPLTPDPGPPLSFSLCSFQRSLPSPNHAPGTPGVS